MFGGRQQSQDFARKGEIVTGDARRARRGQAGCGLTMPQRLPLRGLLRDLDLQLMRQHAAVSQRFRHSLASPDGAVEHWLLSERLVHLCTDRRCCGARTEQHHTQQLQPAVVLACQRESLRGQMCTDRAGIATSVGGGVLFGRFSVVWIKRCRVCQGFL